MSTATIPIGPQRYLARTLSVYFGDVGAYLRNAVSVLDFLRIMRVRLSLSKIGKLVCPSPISADVRLKAFGRRPLRIRSHTTDISVLNEIIVSASYSALLRHPAAHPR